MSADHPAHAAGQLPFLLRQKRQPKKRDPDNWPDPAMLRKKRNEKKLASLRQFFVLIAFFLRFSGPINGDPSGRGKIPLRM